MCLDWKIVRLITGIVQTIQRLDWRDLEIIPNYFWKTLIPYHIYVVNYCVRLHFLSQRLQFYLRVVVKYLTSQLFFITWRNPKMRQWLEGNVRCVAVTFVHHYCWNLWGTLRCEIWLHIVRNETNALTLKLIIDWTSL